MSPLDFAPVGNCPSEAVLRQFQAGNLEIPDVERLAAHLSWCGRCLDKVEESSLPTVQSASADDFESPWPDLRDDPHYRRMEDRAKGALGELDAAECDVVSETPFPAMLLGNSQPFDLGPYRIVELIGRGGMGTVYRAWHTHLKQQKAVKFLNPHLTAPSAVARFRREMEVIGGLDHPNVTRATDAGEWNGMHYLVMDFVLGKTLSVLSQAGPINIADACELIRQAAVGLQYVSLNNLVHRDIKPSNVILSEQGIVKILDLGLATLARPARSTDITSRHDVLGTADYMAPEQWRESRRVDVRADIYSLGCTFYRLLSGRAPFDLPECRSNDQKRLAHLKSPVVPITGLRTDVPPAVAIVLEQMLQKSPEKRYAQPQEVADALAPFCSGSDLQALVRQAPAAPGLPEMTETNVAGRENTYAPATVPRPRQTWPWAMLAALLIAAGGIGAFALLRWPMDSPLVPATEREFRLHTWHNLLDRPPEPLHVTNVSGQSQWSFDPVKGTLSITAFGKQLLSLGRIEGKEYRLNVAFEQPQPSPTYGIFFGGRRSTESGTETLHCQKIVVQRSRNSPPNGLILDRGSATLLSGTRPDGPFWNLAHLSSMPIARSLNSERLGAHVPVRLDLVVSKEPGLSSVTFNGDHYPDLSGVNGNFTFSDYEGDFGIFCDNCTVIVSSAQLFPTQ